MADDIYTLVSNTYSKINKKRYINILCDSNR